ncbi:MAG: DUF4380 domain-containing protein [Paludibacteraceae bacterium]|nr:DUF4380 domain-containing protein [Candidatus Physcocola equi]MCQ2234721.1 DUF4380 domain-containing protein [Paludibacteraceae bacterium]
MIYIENGGTRLGILPKVGGRVVSLSKKGAPNIFKSDKTLWDKDEVPEVNPENLNFYPYHGQEVWVGPQSEWWKHQDLNEEQLHSTLFWPPDPYISWGEFTVTRHISCQIEMEGPESPISGVKLTKRINITADGVVHFEVTATNIRKEPVSWDLWLIARTSGNNPTFVPVASPFDVHVGGPTHPDYEGPAPYVVADGYFSFTPDRRDVSYEACTAKAFIQPSKPFIATLSGRDLLIIRFEHHSPNEIHPEQREVEVYNYASSDHNMLTEMEYHAPYRTLQPGESMTAKQTWEVLPFSGIISREAIINTLNNL